MKNAQITLHSDGAAEPAFALTDARGRFTCMTNDTSGVLPGEYRVTVARARPQGGLPEKYADSKTTPLKITVVAGQNDLALTLED
ncbi:MAG: hypothetical protein ACT4QC_18525 [Planctomycetaceae bacterium]